MGMGQYQGFRVYKNKSMMLGWISSATSVPAVAVVNSLTIWGQVTALESTSVLKVWTL